MFGFSKPDKNKSDSSSTDSHGGSQSFWFQTNTCYFSEIVGQYLLSDSHIWDHDVNILAERPTPNVDKNSTTQPISGISFQPWSKLIPWFEIQEQNGPDRQKSHKTTNSKPGFWQNDAPKSNDHK